MSKLNIIFFLSVLILSTCAKVWAQHPRIWVNDQDKPRILENIKQYEWAENLRKQLETHVDPWADRHIDNPQFLLSRLPKTWGEQNWTTADFTKATADRPYGPSGNAPVPTFHRSDDYLTIKNSNANYELPKLEELPAYNKNPFFGLEMKVKGSDRKEYVPYSGPLLRQIYTEVTILGVDSAVLYYLTGKKKYAQLTVDILHAFVEPLSHMELVHTATRRHAVGLLIGDFLRDARITFPMFPLMYDMTYDYLQNSNTTVYDAASKSRKTFNEGAAQATFEKLARTVLDKGITKSNWAILEGYGALFNILAISNNSKRNALFKDFYTDDTTSHDPFSWSMANFTSENLWPESLGYSIDVNHRMLRMMEIIDRNKDLLKVDVFAVSPKMLEGPFIYDNLTYPNERTLRFGDSPGNRFPTQNLYSDVAVIAQRKGLKEYERRAKEALGAHYAKAGSFKPKISFERLGYTAPLKLLWGVDPNPENGKPPTTEHAIHISHAGIILQRNYDTDDVKEYGLMYYTGGASYVHAHGSGIDLELYGAGRVMGQDFGTGGYGNEVHNGYANRHASHNTVIVNGSAKWGEGGWRNVMSPTKLLAAEPAPFKKPVANDFGFSCQALDDQINNANQQRCVAMIRTGPESGYYMDLFRSESKGENKFSDYLYHNVGDNAELLNMNDSSVALENTPNRYQNDIGDTLKQPGWRWFEDTKTSNPTDATVKVRFNLDSVQRYLNAYLPGGSGNREISLAYGPATPLAADGYDKKKTPIMTIRRQGAAWKAPYVVVFEPAQTKSGYITDTQLIRQDGDTVGVIVTSEIGDATVKDFIFAQDGANKTYENSDIKFTGRFAVIRERTIGSQSSVQLYIGDGSSLTYKGQTLTADNTRRGFLDAANTPTDLALKRFTFASVEGGTINSDTPVDIAYGAQGEYIFSPNRTGNIACINSMCRKDPIPGTKKSCYIRESKVAYGGQPTALPGTLEAEHYDYGGEGISYSDKSSVNKGAEETQFRIHDGVDIVKGNGSMALGYIGDGEWTEYTVAVNKSATFSVSLVAAASVDTTVVTLDVNGTPGLTLPLANTGSNDVYQTTTDGIDLPAGEHVIRVNYQGGDFHVDKLMFELR